MGNAAREVLDEVKSTFNDASNDRRRILFGRLTELCASISPYAAQDLLDAFDTLISTLVEQMDCGARIELSQKLCTLERPPKTILHILAEDEFEVAEPILRKSEAVREEVLVRIAKSGDDRHLCAIAARKIVSTHLCDIIVSRGGRNTLVTLAGNRGVFFSQFDFELLVAKARDDVTLQVVLTRRQDLPSGEVERLGWVAQIVCRRREAGAENELSDVFDVELQRRLRENRFKQ